MINRQSKASGYSKNAIEKEKREDSSKMKITRLCRKAKYISLKPGYGLDGGGGGGDEGTLGSVFFRRMDLRSPGNKFTEPARCRPPLDGGPNPSLRVESATIRRFLSDKLLCIRRIATPPSSVEKS